MIIQPTAMQTFDSQLRHETFLLSAHLLWCLGPTTVAYLENSRYLIRKIPVVWFANLKDGITMCIVDHETQQMLHVNNF